MRSCGHRSILVLCTVVVAACSAATEPPAGPPTLRIGADTTLLLDEVLRPTVIAMDGRGRAIAAPNITWSSSAPDVALVDASGHIAARSRGTATITATMDTITARLAITVAPQFTQLAAGSTHVCGITGHGEIFCWGASLHGELGPTPGIPNCTRFGPGIKCSGVPVKSSNLRPAVLTAGDMHTCALDASGSAYCWGANFYGQLGTGTTFDVQTPTPVSGGLTFTQLVTGRMHNCGITPSGDAYCWGWDWTGELGAGGVSTPRCDFGGTYPCNPTPQLVVGGHQWTQLSANDRATCGITPTGQLFCWGLDVGGNDGLYCQAADIQAGCTHTPMLISTPRAYKAMTSGSVHHCQQGLDDTLDCWGSNYWGQLGNGTMNPSSVPAPVAGGTAYTAFVALRGSTCALTTAGVAQCWGRGAEGEIGNGATQDALVPTTVSGDLRFTALSANTMSDFVCGISDAGRAYCWGGGDFGQLGDGDFTSKNVPTQVQLVRQTTTR